MNLNTPRRVNINLSIDPDKMLGLLALARESEKLFNGAVHMVGANIGSITALLDLDKSIDDDIIAGLGKLGIEVVKAEKVEVEEGER